MKKLLIMASLFWPQKNSGGPPVSILNLVNSIKDHFEIYIISNNHEIGEDQPLPGIHDGWNTFPFGKAWYIPRGQHGYKTVYSLIEQVKPDVIYQNSFFSHNDLLPVLMYKRRNRHVKVVIAPRGELYPERIRCGRMKKQLYCMLFRFSGLLRDVYFQGTGEDECMQGHRFLGVPADHLLNIQNLSVVQTSSFSFPEKQIGFLRLVYIARVHPTKNTLKAIQWLGNVKGNVQFDIYGPIEGEDYWKLCQQAVKELPDHIRVCYKGMVEHDQVGEVISGYHGYYMPTNGENFGHSIVESMLVGRPVIISDQTPWTDVQGVGGYVYPLDQQEKFTQAIDCLCAMGQSEYEALCKGAKNFIHKRLNTEDTITQYIAAFDGEVR